MKQQLIITALFTHFLFSNTLFAMPIRIGSEEKKSSNPSGTSVSEQSFLEHYEYKNPSTALPDYSQTGKSTHPRANEKITYREELVRQTHTPSSTPNVELSRTIALNPPAPPITPTIHVPPRAPESIPGLDFSYGSTSTDNFLANTAPISSHAPLSVGPLQIPVGSGSNFSAGVDASAMGMLSSQLTSLVNGDTKRGLQQSFNAYQTQVQRQKQEVNSQIAKAHTSIDEIHASIRNMETVNRSSLDVLDAAGRNSRNRMIEDARKQIKDMPESKPLEIDLDAMIQQFNRAKMAQAKPNVVQHKLSETTQSSRNFDQQMAEVQGIRDRLNSANPTEPTRIEAKEFGLSATELAYDAFASKDEAEGSFFKEAAREFADIAVGLDPITGFGRGIYELTSGKNLIDGRELANWERGLAFAAVVTGGSSNTIAKSSKALLKFGSKALPHALPAIEKGIEKGTHLIRGLIEGAKSAGQWRNSAGTATISKALHDSSKILHGSQGNAGFIPKEIGEKLVGKHFENFDHFRKDFWKSISESKYVSEFKFNADDISRMSKGKAPLVSDSQRVGARATYELHHAKPITKNGGVYEIDNIIIATPRYHVGVFHKN